ncbi:hypothetical protein SLS56_011602 [Neofusicoccum ribis]|uniref:Uncharacterized protein n=1 Tax=Neofusicoccum ribis TaxID=45134 RepID=A0ABR3SBI5_9PEZI
MSDEVTPPDFKFTEWKIGTQPVTSIKRATTTLVNKDYIPPEGVMLSSDLAYKVIRLVLQTGILSLRTLADY